MSQSPPGEGVVARQVAELEMLAKAPTPAALRALREALKSGSPVVRQVAATSLGRIGNPIATPNLVQATHDPAAEVRRSAIWALGQIANPEALDALKLAARDADGDTRRAAAWALKTARGAGATSRRDTKRKRRTRGLLITLGAFGLVAVAAGLAVTLLWSRPLGPSLVALETPTQEVAAQVVTTPARAATPLCGGPAVLKVLIVGLDSEGYYAGFADAVRVARVDFTTPSIILLGIPRDLWVTIPGLQSAGINEDKLKMAYPYGNVDQVPGGGPSLLAQTLTYNLGLRVDRYAATDFATFETAIDEMGGIDINLPQAVGDEKTDPPYFPAGWTHMDGKTALSYARVRPENSSDLARMDRQNQVISAIRAKLTSSDFLPKAPGLVEQLRGSVATDLSPAEISSLLCIARTVQPDQMSVVKIDKPLVLSVTDEFGHERLLPDSEAIRRFMRAFDTGDLDTLRQMTRK